MSNQPLVIGAHVRDEDPLVAAAERNADAVQFFLADPQKWTAPQPRADQQELLDSPIDVYIHSPYVLNLASTNNRIRIPSRKLVAQHAAAAAAVGAKGLIVHGGHVAKGDDPQVGADNWRKAFAEAHDKRGGFEVPILIENTAGGGLAMARTFDDLARLWDAVGDYNPGFCLDTCHAHAGGLELGTVVERVLAITGRIDLIHCNDSRDEFDSGRDRHTTLGTGQIDIGDIVDVLRAAAAPVILETPAEGQAKEIEFLRSQLT